jgi:hypothetical protein
MAAAKVAHLNKVHGFATVVSVDDLAGLPETEWVTVAWTGLGNSPYFAEQVRHLQSAMVQLGAEDDTIVATGRVAQLRSLAALIAIRYETPVGRDNMVVRAYALTNGVKGPDAQRVIRELFDVPGTTITQTDGNYRVSEGAYQPVRVSVAPNGSRLIVRASPADHELVKTALANLP